MMGDITAGRLPNLLWFVISTAAAVVRHLPGWAAAPEAQPLPCPSAASRRCGTTARMLADAALLLLLATVGILQRVHETSMMPGHHGLRRRLAFYALARMLDTPATWARSALGVALAGQLSGTRLGGRRIPIMAGRRCWPSIPRSALWPRLRWLPAAGLCAAIIAGLVDPSRPALAAATTGSATGRLWNIDNFALAGSRSTCCATPARPAPGTCGPPGRWRCWRCGGGATGCYAAAHLAGAGHAGAPA